MVIVLTDQLRRCSLGLHGDPLCRTPHLDALAAGGLTFERAVSSSPKCEGFRVSLATGRWPHAAGEALDPERELLARSFKAAGYRTGYVGKWHLTPEPTESGFVPGSARPGWDWFAGHERGHTYVGATYFEGDDPEPRVLEGFEPHGQVALAREFLAGADGQPSLLVLSFGPPHQPVQPPREWRLYDADEVTLRPNVPGLWAEPARRLLARYYGLITGVDDALGRLITALEELDLRENTVLVFTSDHGVMNYSHGMDLKQKPFEEALGVPLVFSWPGRPEPFGGARVDTPVGTVDLLPTLLGLAGLPVPADLPGRDVLADPSERPLYLQNPFDNENTWLLAPWRGLLSGEHKYALSGSHVARELLFDLSEDPFEQRNLAESEDHAELLRHLRAECEALAEGLDDPFFRGER